MKGKVNILREVLIKNPKQINEFGFFISLIIYAWKFQALMNKHHHEPHSFKRWMELFNIWILLNHNEVI